MRDRACLELVIESLPMYLASRMAGARQAKSTETGAPTWKQVGAFFFWDQRQFAENSQLAADFLAISQARCLEKPRFPDHAFLATIPACNLDRTLPSFASLPMP